MHGWDLETVRSLSGEDYDQIIEWLQDKAARARGEESVDMDALIRGARGERDDGG